MAAADETAAVVVLLELEGAGADVAAAGPPIDRILERPTAALYSWNVALRPTRSLPLARPFGNRLDSATRAGAGLISTAPQARMKTSASCSIVSPSASQ